MNVALPKEGVCKKRKEKVSNFQSFSGGFKPILLACKEVPAIPLCWSFCASVGGYNFIWQKYLKAGVKGLASLQLCTRRVRKNVTAFPWMEQSLGRCFHGVSALAALSDMPWDDNATNPPADRLPLHGGTRPSYLMAHFWAG